MTMYSTNVIVRCDWQY